MSASRLKYRKMEKSVRRAANAYFKRSNRECILDDQTLCSLPLNRSVELSVANIEMREMFKEDRKVLREFAQLLHDGYITKAQDLIECMDTAVYEVIPARVYNFVCFASG